MGKVGADAERVACGGDHEETFKADPCELLQIYSIILYFLVC